MKHFSVAQESKKRILRGQKISLSMQVIRIWQRSYQKLNLLIFNRTSFCQVAKKKLWTFLKEISSVHN